MSIDDATPSDWNNLRRHSLVEDVVNRPTHYNTGAIECIDGIKESMNGEEFKGYLKGNVIKYVWRYKNKGKPIEDLRKARWYLEKLIEEEL